MADSLWFGRSYSPFPFTGSAYSLSLSALATTYVNCFSISCGVADSGPISFIWLARRSSPGPFTCGIKDLRIFNRALCAKSLWHALFEKGLWDSIIQAKYLGGVDVGIWMGTGTRSRVSSSKIWYNLLSALPILNFSLCWKVGCGNMISIGTDPILGIGEGHRLSDELITTLHDRGIFVLNHLWTSSAVHADTRELIDISDLPVALLMEWSVFRLSLLGAGIQIQAEPDRLVWEFNPLHGTVTARLAYTYLMEGPLEHQVTGIGSMLWSPEFPLRISCFVWLLLHNKIATWPNLQRHGFTGPGVCILCMGGVEKVNHLFGSFIFFQAVWTRFGTFKTSLPGWDLPTFPENLDRCYKVSRGDIYFIFLVLSDIWCARNQLIFNGFHPNVDLLLARILARQTIASSPPIRDCIGVPPCPTGSVMYPIGFFDEASQQGICGAGMIIKLSSTYTFHLCMGVG